MRNDPGTVTIDPNIGLIKTKQHNKTKQHKHKIGVASDVVKAKGEDPDTQVI